MGIFGGETNLREEDTFNFGRGGCGIPVEQRSPTFLSRGTGFLEDNFSTDWVGGRMVLG